MSKKVLRGTAINKRELQKIKKNIQQLSPYPNRVKIIAVTKSQGYRAIEEANKEGIHHIGENKIQELENKIKNKKIPLTTKIHFIGRLQRNKVKKAISLCYCIQTVNSIKLAKKIEKEAKKTKKKQNIYIQINIGKDAKKQGLQEEELFDFCDEIKKMKNIQVNGIMTMLPQKITKEKAQAFYIKTKDLAKKINKEKIKTCKEISMGMSQDYKLAIGCGATNLRIGTKLYGPRK